jgi:hypothetical protein
MKIDWKQKYMELRSKYMNAIDAAYKLGFQEGQKNAEFEFTQQQMAQMQEQMAMMEQAAAEPAPEEMMGEEGAVDPETGEMLPPEAMGEEGVEAAGGDELDQSIGELEQFVKDEDKPDHAALLKSLHSQKNEEIPATKSEKAEKLTSIVDKF